MVGKLSNLDNFIKDALVSEMKEFRADRAKYTNAVTKLESFIKENLAREISEFAEDKADLVRTKVAVVTEGKKKLQALRANFIKKSASLVENTVKSTLRSELKQLKQDIQEAKENNFGRKIFEAYATEFSATHLNERAEVKKLVSAMTEMQGKLNEAQEAAESAMQVAAAKDDEIKRINESISRKAKLDELLKPLSKEKAEVMVSLLESVPTARLSDAFKKYLSPVMEGKASQKSTLVESKKEITGDRTANVEELSNIIDIKRLAGLVNNK
jgi:hypothetical protein